MTDRELLQMALDALENAHANEPIWKTPIKEASEALRSRLANEFNPDWNQVEALQESLREHMAEIQRLRARLAQPEQDDGYCQACEGNYCTAKDGCVARDNPPQREWQGLTDEEVVAAWDSTEPYFDQADFAKAIEAKLKEKNT